LTCQYALDYISRGTDRDRRPISRHNFHYSMHVKIGPAPHTHLMHPNRPTFR